MNQQIPAKYVSTGNPEYPYVVLRADTGKIMKSKNYQEPNAF